MNLRRVQPGFKRQTATGAEPLRLSARCCQPAHDWKICKLLDPDVFSRITAARHLRRSRALGAVESRRLGATSRADNNRGFPEFDLHEFLAHMR